VHVRQKHTVDILLAELLTIVNWYNPFVWLIRYSIRQNLEFIADCEVLKKGLDKKSYQYHLLSVMGQVEYKLANNFNFSSLKKRIVMMNKLRSARPSSGCMGSCRIVFLRNLKVLRLWIRAATLLSGCGGIP
jgi:beta-lactamase regulating signal transducer with metallopeptidase domain